MPDVSAEKLIRLTIASIYEESGDGKIIDVSNVEIGFPEGGWTADFIGQDNEELELLTAVFDGDETISYGLKESFLNPEPRQDAQTFQPPDAAKNNAQKVLDWKTEHGDEVKGMTSVGWARARQLASGKPISLDTVKRMAAFNRHRKNSTVAPEYKGEPWRDRGHVAWLGWGGTTGIDWARRISSNNDAADYSAGDTVSWQWGEGTARGQVTGVFPRRVQRTIEGTKVVRNGTEDNPALVIEQENGSKVLKLASEVSRA